MLKIENVEICGFPAAIRGMRNPKNSWAKSDSDFTSDLAKEMSIESEFHLGSNDFKLMETLASAGTDHRKFLRMIAVYLDVTAPLYWWKEYDTYKVGTVANSCSTMHKIAEKEFTLEDFSHEHLEPDAISVLEDVIHTMNVHRQWFNEGSFASSKNDWWQMIQLLPSSYNQRRTLMLNYEVLANIYPARRNHKLDEWHTFCDWIEGLPYSELITGKEEKNDSYWRQGISG